MFFLFIIFIILYVVVDMNIIEGIYLYFCLKFYFEVIFIFFYINYSINFCIYVLLGKLFRKELNRMFIYLRFSS